MHRTDTNLNHIAAVCGAITALIGAIIVIEWVFIDIKNFSLGNKFIPMAGETALLFLIFGIALAISGKSRFNRKIRFFIIGTAIFIGFVGLLTIIDISTGYIWNISAILKQTNEEINGIPTGKMSFLTAFCFIFISISLILLKGKNAKFSVIFSTLTLSLGYIIVVGYCYGVPFFYNGNTIPVALPTAITFIISSLGLLIAAGKETFPLKYILGDTTRARLLRNLLAAIFIMELIRNIIEAVYLTHYNSNPALANSLIDILGLLATGFIASFISRRIGKSIDKNIEERKWAVESLIESESRYRRLFETAKDGIFILDAETGKIVDVNPFLIELLGYSKEYFVEKTIWEIGFFKDIVANHDNFLELQQKKYVRYEDLPLETVYGQRLEVEFVSNVYLVNGKKVIQCNIRDITIRKLNEKKQNLFAKILEHLNRQNEWQNLIKDILIEIKTFTGLDAVAIRLREGEDYPYFVQDGFSDDFLKTERYLCSYDIAGNIIHDINGNPFLECMCGNIICNRTDPSKSFYTTGGSFWANNTTQLIASTNKEDLQARTRNRCNGEGYESVALIPLRSGNEIIGLLQLNDKKPDRFTIDMINFFERVASSIGIAFSRIQSEERIKGSEQKYRNIFENAQEGIFQTNINGTYVSVNPSLAKMYGYDSPEELIKSRTDISNDSYFNPKERDNFLKMMEDKGYVKGYEYEAKRKDGSKIWFYEDAKAFKDEYGKIKYFNGFVVDISKRKKAEEELKEQTEKIEIQNIEYEALNEDLIETNRELIKAMEKAEESDKLKTAFLQNMSHEIRTPLNGIIGFSGLLNVDDLSKEDIKEFTDLINQSGKRLLEIVNNVLDISKIQTGQVKIEKKPISINSIFSDLLTFFSSLAKAKNISLNYHNRDDKYFTINTDENKLHQILLNLINNAIKFTNSGSVDFGYEIKENIIQFYVKDTGIGISADLYERIFDRFIQADQSIVRNFEGAGLGLAICRGLVELLGGKIWLESEINKGTTFFFNLPYAPTDLPSKENRKYSESSVKPAHGKILIVEDDWVSSQYLNRILINSDVTVLHAENGKQAVELVRNITDIDLILMDIRMPVMDGIEATKLIKQIRPDLPIVAQTAYAFSEEKNKILSIGCDDYLSKPIEKNKINALIKKYLN